MPESSVLKPVVMQSMMGPYTRYGLAGAGAGLLFYFVAGRKGGPVTVPGTPGKQASRLELVYSILQVLASNKVAALCVKINQYVFAVKAYLGL